MKNDSPRTAKQGFLRNEDGSVAVWVGMAMTMVVGFSALAIDMGNIYTRQYELQVAADSAALAALSQITDQDAARALAHTYVERHLSTAKHGAVLTDSDVEFGNWNDTTKAFTASTAPINSLRVTLRKAATNSNAEGMFFSRMLGVDTVDLSTSSVAIQSPPASCVLALDPSVPEALRLDSNSQINATGCQVTVNSSSSSALFTDSNSQVTADNICLVGEYNQQGGGATPPPDTNCPVAKDPLASLPEPSFSGCDHNNRLYDHETDTASPGVYCGGLTLDSSSDITFDPGIYVIKGGNLLVDSNSKLTGSGVMFFLTEGAAIHFNSSSKVSLTAPTSGPYAGMIFFQDRDYETTHLFDSNNISVLEGMVYLPTGVLKANSNSRMGGSSAFSMYIAKQFDFNSKAGLDINVDYENSSVPLPPGLAGSSRLAM